MAHSRTLIRQAVVAQLIAADTAAGTRVYSTRVEEHRQSRLPAISVYTLSESIDQNATEESSPRVLVRNTKIEIVGWVAGTAAVPVDEAMDNLAEEIEAAMDSDPYFGDLVVDSMLEETVMEVLEDGGRSDALLGVVALVYSVTYQTSPYDSGDVADDFITVGAAHEPVGGVADTDHVTHQFTVQEPPP